MYVSHGLSATVLSLADLFGMHERQLCPGGYQVGLIGLLIGPAKPAAQGEGKSKGRSITEGFLKLARFTPRPSQSSVS